MAQSILFNGFPNQGIQQRLGSHIAFLDATFFIIKDNGMYEIIHPFRYIQQLPNFCLYPATPKSANMPKEHKYHPSKRKGAPPRRNMNLTDIPIPTLALLVGSLGSQIRVEPLIVTILADSHGSDHHLGQWIEHMAGPHNLFRINIVTAPGLRVSELRQTTG